MKNYEQHLGILIGFLIGLTAVSKFAGVFIVLIVAAVWGFRYVDQKIVLLCTPILMYCSYQSLILFSYPFRASTSTMMSVYIVFLIMSVPVLAGLVKLRRVPERLDGAVLVGGIISCAILGFDYFQNDTCRAEALSSNPLMPPIVLIPLICAIVTVRMSSKRETLLDYVALTSLVVAVGAFAGARMGFYSCIMLITLIASQLCYVRAVRSAAKCFGSLILGALLVILVDQISGCGFVSRLLSHTQTVIELSKVFDSEFTELSESSTNYRWQMWSNGWVHLTQNATVSEFIFGVGRAGEIEIINTGLGTSFTQSHNQYLSWLIASGIVGFLLAAGIYGSLLWRGIGFFPAFVYCAASGLSLVTNGPFYDTSTTAQLLLLLLFMLAFLQGRRDRNVQ